MLRDHPPGRVDNPDRHPVGERDLSGAGNALVGWA
jgi:hypothetical protein